MSGYRVYFIEKDGHIAHAPIVLECQKDESAIDEAKKLGGDQDIEIWHGARMISYVIAHKN